MGSPRNGCDNQTSRRLDAMAARDPGSSARINAQGMAAVGQMAGRIRRLLLEAMLAKIASINSGEFLSIRC
jgi:hypothetical protein